MKQLNILVLLVVSLAAMAQSKYRAPIDSAFYMQTTKEGYIHPPYKVKHQKVTTKSSTALPEVYDLRNINGETALPAIRNQNPYGTCWAFAVVASIESCWYNNYNTGFIALSEGNMAKTHGYDFDIDDGGNEYVATAYLSRLDGPVLESVDPYSEVNNSAPVAINKTTDIPAYVDQAIWLGDNHDVTKTMIMKYGAAATSMTTSYLSSYYNNADDTYFYNGTSAVNHGVTIVGWNDTITVTGGSAGAPSAPGAWIIRNSWGTSTNDNGYFYASYEDKYIGRTSQIYYGRTLTSEVDTVLDYAELGVISAYSSSNIDNTYAYAAVKHNAERNLFITQMGAAIMVEGTSIQIAICQNFDGKNFTDTIAQTENIFCEFAGFQTIDLPASITPGDFYIVARYETPGESNPLPAETYVANYADPKVEADKMWISDDGKAWEKGGLDTEFDFDLALKIYAKYLEPTTPYFTLDKNVACLNETIELSNHTTGEADSYVWTIADKTISTYTKEETATFSLAETGVYDITLTAYKDEIAYAQTKTHAIEIIDELNIRITVANSADYYARNKTISLFGSGAESYQWYAEGYLDGTTGRYINIAPDVEQLWVYMHASQGEYTGIDSILLNMATVAYDDIEDALELQINTQVSGISNQYASEQQNEPTPPLDGCSNQTEWCSEGGIQNSIWFKFTAPTSGSVTIHSYGFDNQLALYDATYSDTWSDIMSGDESKYTILAANDDYNDDYSAVITAVNNLTPNKTYWIQMDGSAGGAEGTIDIIVKDTVSTALPVADMQNIQVTNTPHQFTIQGNLLNDAQVTIINSTGATVLNQEYNSTTLAQQCKALSNGFYIINIKCEDTNYVYKTVIQQPWQMTIE